MVLGIVERFPWGRFSRCLNQKIVEWMLRKELLGAVLMAYRRFRAVMVTIQGVQG